MGVITRQPRKLYHYFVSTKFRKSTPFSRYKPCARVLRSPVNPLAKDVRVVFFAGTFFRLHKGPNNERTRRISDKKMNNTNVLLTVNRSTGAHKTQNMCANIQKLCLRGTPNPQGRFFQGSPQERFLILGTFPAGTTKNGDSRFTVVQYGNRLPRESFPREPATTEIHGKFCTGTSYRGELSRDNYYIGSSHHGMHGRFCTGDAHYEI